MRIGKAENVHPFYTLALLFTVGLSALLIGQYLLLIPVAAVLGMFAIAFWPFTPDDQNSQKGGNN